jgi:RHS repeat-associated protein
MNSERGNFKRSKSRLQLGGFLLAAVSSAFLALLGTSSVNAAECTNTWTGAAEGTWQAAANWSAGHAPSSSDIACIGSGKTVNVTAGTNQAAIVQGEGSLTIKESTLELFGTSEPSAIKNLTVKYNAVLTGPGTINVSSSFAWTNESTMSGTGATVLGAKATGSVTTGGGWARLKERRLVNEGTFAMNEGVMLLTEKSEILNKGTFTVNHEGTFDIFAEGTTPKFVNSGLLQKTSGAGETELTVNFENQGEVNAKSGTLLFSGKTGALAGGSVLKGSIRLYKTSFTTDSFTGKEATLTMREATLSANVGSGSTIGNLVMDYQAVVSGAGSLEITKALTWKSESTMSGTGTTVIGSLATAGITTYSAKLATRTLRNEGILNFEGTEGRLDASESAVIENNATINANAIGAYARFPGIYTTAGSALLINHGTILKSTGTNDFWLNLNVENYATISVKTGRLHYERKGSTVSLKPESILEGVNRVDLSSVVGNSFQAPNGTLSIRESPFILEGKSLIGRFEPEYETAVSGSGDLEVTQAFVWKNQNTLGGSGTLVLGPASNNILDGGATTDLLAGQKIVNEGTFTQTSSSKVKFEKGATFVNEGIYNLNSEPYPTWIRDSISFKVGEAPNKFINNGLFQRTEGKLALEVTPEFENNGVIKAQSSGIEIKNPITIVKSQQPGHHSKCGDPVDCATGNFSESQTDFLIDGRGVPLELTRTYSAQAAAAAVSPGPFGYGWTSSFSEHLLVEGGGATVTLMGGDGSTTPFTRTGGGPVYAGPAWSLITLSGSPETGYTLTSADQTVLSFSGAGRFESVADRNGNETTFSYDESGRLKAITDASGRQITLTYNIGGQVESAKDPMGHVVKYAYESGSLASVTLPGQASPRWKFKYDASHRLTTMTDGREGKTVNEYDASSRVKSQTDPGGHTLAFAYEGFHTTITNKATGAVTDEWFTSKGQPYSITHGYGTASATTETFSYDSAGQLIRETDGNGHAITYGYDGEGNRTSEKDAAGDETKWAYNATHDVISMTTPGGETTTIARDGNGNPETVSRPAPEEATQTYGLDYNEYGELESLTDPLERTWGYAYDGQGNLIAETDPLGNTRTSEYDEDSRFISTVSPRGNLEGAEPPEYETSIERDPLGRPLKVTDPLGHSTEYGYDGNGNLVTETDANGHTTKFVYDADDEQIKVERPSGAVLKTEYDGAGGVKKQTDGNNHTTSYVRNVLEQPVEVIDPLGRKTIQEFDSAGNIKAVIDPAERKATYSYDAADRLIGVNYSEEATPDEGYEYDADGNRLSMTDGTGESTFSYDELGRLTEAENGHGDVVGYGYDLAEQVTGLLYPNGKSVARAFDAAGRLESVTDWLGGTTSFAYDADSNLEATAFPSPSANVDEYAYDRDDRMSGASFDSGPEALASISYSRNKIGQVEDEAVNGLPGPSETPFAYDKNDRLTNAGEAGFEYDAADNLIKGLGSTNAYDAASQLETGTGIAYTYDKLGERTKATPEAGPATSYGYDQAGRLTAIERSEEGETAAINESFTYDGTGLVADRTSEATTEHLTWDLEAALPLLLSDGQRSYIYGPGEQPIEQISSEETPTYLHSDQLGTTRLLTDAGGEVTGAFSYGPYGSLIGASGSETTPMGFAGQYTDSTSGLQYLRARFYDPSTAQFLTRDPLEGLTREPYAYASDDPLNLTDPSGELSIDLPIDVPVPCVITIPVPGVGEACGAAAAGGAIIGSLLFPEKTSEDDVIDPTLANRLSESRSNRKSAKKEKTCDPQGLELKREGEELLGRGSEKHSSAKRDRWNKWWKDLSRGQKKKYTDAGGPKPKKDD